MLILVSGGRPSPAGADLRKNLRGNPKEPSRGREPAFRFWGTRILRAVTTSIPLVPCLAREPRSNQLGLSDL